MADIVNMSDQFKGLPMADLIGGPLQAACDAQVRMAQATAQFIDQVGMNPVLDAQGKPTGARTAKTVDFSFTRPVQDEQTGQVGEEKVDLQVPLLALINTPALAIQEVNVSFDMEVKSSVAEKETTDSSATLDAEAKYGWGLFSATVKIHGSVASHKENTRQSDNSAKYHVEVKAAQNGTPEGLSRVLDMLQSAIAPRKVTATLPASNQAAAPVSPTKPAKNTAVNP